MRLGRQRPAYVLEFDNGHDYEEHRTEIILVVIGLASQHRAQKEAERLTAWMKRKHEAAPPSPVTTETEDELEFTAALDRENAYYAALRCPHGAECLRQGARDGCASVRSYPVKLIA